MGEVGDSAGKSEGAGNVGGSAAIPSSAQLPGKLKKLFRNDMDNSKYFTQSLFFNETGDVEVHTNASFLPHVINSTLNQVILINAHTNNAKQKVRRKTI